MSNRGRSSRNTNRGGDQEESSSRPPTAVSLVKDARCRRRGGKALERRGARQRPSPSRTGPTMRPRADPFGEYQHQSSRRILKREPTGLRISDVMNARQDGDGDVRQRRQDEGEVARSDGRVSMEERCDVAPTPDMDGEWDAAPLKKNVSGSKQRSQSSSDLLSVSTSISNSRSTVLLSKSSSTSAPNNQSTSSSSSKKDTPAKSNSASTANSQSSAAALTYSAVKNASHPVGGVEKKTGEYKNFSLAPTPRVNNITSRPKLSVRPDHHDELGHLPEEENLAGSRTGGSSGGDAEVEIPMPSATPRSLGLIAVEEGRNNIADFDGDGIGNANVLKNGKNNVPKFDGNDSSSKQLFRRTARSKESRAGKGASAKKDPMPPITPKSLGAVAIDEDGKNNIESNDALGFGSGSGSRSSGKKTKRSSLRKFVPSVVSSITGPSMIKGVGARLDEVDYGIDPSRGSFDLVIVPKGSGGSGNDREKKKNKRHADAAAAIVATAAATLAATSSSTTAATQSQNTLGITYWSSLSVRAAVAVMTAGGDEPVAQRAANVVLEEGKRANSSLDLQGLATRVSVVVLEAGGDNRAAASVAVAIMNEAEPSNALAEKSKGRWGGNVKRDGSGLSDRFDDDHADKGSPPIKTINEQWLEAGKEGVQSSSTITDPDATIPSETKSMASKRRNLQEKEEEIEVRNRALAEATRLNEEKEQAIKERIKSLEAARDVGKRRAQEREVGRKKASAEAKRKAVEEMKKNEGEKRRAAERAAAERASAEADAKRRELQKREEEIERRRKDLEERQRKAEAERAAREEEIVLAKIKLEERHRMTEAERAAREAEEVARLEGEKEARRIETEEAKRLELWKKEAEIERRNKELEERLKAIKWEEEELERRRARQGNNLIDNTKKSSAAMQEEDESMTVTMASKDHHLADKEGEIAQKNKELEEAARSNLQEQEIRERMAAMEAAADRRDEGERLLERQIEEEAIERAMKGKEDARRRRLRDREKEIARQKAELSEASHVNQQKEQELNDRMAALDAATAALLERASNIQREIDDRRLKTNVLENVEEGIISGFHGNHEAGVGEFSVATPMGSVGTPPYGRDFNSGNIDATGGVAGYRKNVDEARNKRDGVDNSSNGSSSVSFTKVTPHRPTQESKKKGVFEQFAGKLYSILDVACDSAAWVSNQHQQPHSGGGATTIDASPADTLRNDGSSSQDGTATAESNSRVTPRVGEDYTAFGVHEGGSKAGAVSFYPQGAPSNDIAGIVADPGNVGRGRAQDFTRQEMPHLRHSNLAEDQHTPDTLAKGDIGGVRPHNDTNGAIGQAMVWNSRHQMPDQATKLMTKTSDDSNPNRILKQALNMTMKQQGEKSLAQHQFRQDDHPQEDMSRDRNCANEMFGQSLYHATNQLDGKNGQLNKALYRAMSKPQNEKGQASLALNQALHEALDQCATNGQEAKKPAGPPSALKRPSNLRSTSDAAHFTTNPTGGTGLKSKLKVSFLSRKKPFSKVKSTGFPSAECPVNGDSHDHKRPPGIMRTSNGPHPKKKATALRTSPSSKYLRRNRMISVSPKKKVVSVAASPKSESLAADYSPMENRGIMEGVVALSSSPMAGSQVACNKKSKNGNKKGQVFSFSRTKSKLIEL